MKEMPHSPTEIRLNRLQINILVLEFNTFRRQIFKEGVGSFQKIRVENGQAEGQSALSSGFKTR
jgi:hypothetical protein